MQRKVQAFTLSELMVVLVVSSIVVTIAFFALSSVKKQISSIQHTYETQQEILHVERVLLGDLNSSEAVFDSKNGKVQLVNNRDTLLYTFLNDKLVRNSDTIPLIIVAKKMYLHGDEVSNGTIDAIELMFSNTFSTNKVFVYKKNDASHYIENYGI